MTIYCTYYDSFRNKISVNIICLRQSNTFISNYHLCIFYVGFRLFNLFLISLATQKKFLCPDIPKMSFHLNYCCFHNRAGTKNRNRGKMISKLHHFWIKSSLISYNVKYFCIGSLGILLNCV